MPAIVIVGAQWGDEGKGKATDLLGSSVDYVVKFNGGNNAGHTVVIDDQTYALHLLPSGILTPGVVPVIGNGVVVDLDVLFEEVDALEARGVDTSRLVLSANAHLIAPYNRVLDKVTERFLGSRRIGTTGRGIGPTYADKMNRIGIRVQDVFDEGILRAKLTAVLREKNAIFEGIYGEEPYGVDAMTDWLLSFRDLLEPMVADTGVMLRDAMAAGESVLVEGAQATLLDNDHGTYPFVTSSNPSIGGACVGAGIPPRELENIIGVTKAYTTRVGDGPFPTELFDEVGDTIREAGHEYGRTTGRARRIGWLDLPAVKYSASLNGITHLALTLLDVLSAVEEINVCTGYEIDGKHFDGYPMSQTDLHHAKPVYKTLPGWGVDITGCRMRGDLPKEARDYVDYVEAELGAPLCMISVGPERDQAIVERIGV